MAKKIDYASMYTLRPDGRYQGYYRDRSGKRHTVCDRDPERLHQKIAEKEAPKVITFREMAERWHDGMQDIYKPKTWAEYEAPYSRAIERYGDIPGSELTSADIADHLKDMANKGYGDRTIKAQRTVYSLVYKYAANEHDLVEAAKYNPAALAGLPYNRKKAKKRKAPKDNAIVRIILGLNANFGLFPYLLLCTGLRRGEALGLKWRDVDFKHKRITVEHNVTYYYKTYIGTTKTEESEREVPLLPMLAEALKQYRKPSDKPDDYIFHGEDPAKPLCEATYRRRWNNWCRANGFAVQTDAGLTKRGKPKVKWSYAISPHTLRHGYASLSNSGGLPTQLIRDLLGHVNTRTTERYIHDLDGDHRSEYQQITSTIESKINQILKWETDKSDCT